MPPSRSATVVAVIVHRTRVPLVRKVTHASHSRVDSENVVVEVRLADGVTGFGEGVPRDYVTGESVEDSLGLLRRADWAAQLRTVDSWPAAVRLARDFALPAVPGDVRGCQGNAARCAAELALLDAFGKRFGQPVGSVVALPEFAALHAPRPSVRYTGTLTSTSPAKERLRAVCFRIWNMPDIKIKVGTEGLDDLKRLRTFRRILGKSIDFRLDANEAWTPDELPARLQALAPFGISSVEQPVPHEDVASLAALRPRLATAVMLDESLCSARDADLAIQHGWADIFNLRLSKCGGFLPTLDLALRARKAGLACQLGCQIGESGILTAAGRHFACNVGGLRHVEGAYDKYLVAERLTQADLTFGFRGRGAALNGPGLGIVVEPERLARVTVSTETVFGAADAPRQT